MVKSKTIIDKSKKKKIIIDKSKKKKVNKQKQKQLINLRYGKR